ncbi:MAG: response regulator [Magnetovibrio sp.]|nr:response regulator [Magnetovibrio sp.]
MDEKGLKHCSVLVADDNPSSRALLVSTLQDIGVGVVSSVSSGAAAIEHLRHSNHTTMSSKTPPVDLLITEWDMEPVGGMMLINWIRRHADSPDRFTRIVIMSGDLDAEKVERARNAGANAVFAKPFSVNTLRKHVLNVLGNNPAYFKTSNYFGPDRRRNVADVLLEDRRNIKKPYIEALGSGMAPEVGCFDLPHYIGDIALGRPRDQVNTQSKFDAHQDLIDHSETYAAWVCGDVEVLRLAFRLSDQNVDMRKRNISLMSNLVNRLEMEGAFMGYPLITAFARTLTRAIKVDIRLWVQTREIFDAALNGLDIVVRQDIRGDGGALGQELSAQLRKLDKKLMAPLPVNAHRKGVAHLG